MIKVNNFLLPDEFASRGAPRARVRAVPPLGVLARLIPEKGILELIDDSRASGPHGQSS